jgi:hypothetical protein
MNLLALDENTKKDTKKDLKETQQEVMIDLAIKTNNFLEKFSK